MRELPPLNALHAFEAAARQMSFQRAAAELDVTPTAISHQIKKLENHLGQALFIRRNPHPILLTEAGKQLYPVVRDGFDAFAEAIAQLNNHLNNRQSSTALTVTAINDFASKWLVPRLPHFQKTHPDIDIHLQTSVTVVDLHARTVDLAIRYGQGNYPGLASTKLFSDQYDPVCSPLLLKGEHPLNTPDDLVHHTLLHCEWVNYTGPNQPTWQRWLQAAKVTTVDTTKGPKFTGESLVIQSAINGQGIGLCSSIHTADDVARGALVRPFGITLKGFGFYAVHLLNHPKAAQILSFIGWLEDMAKQDPAEVTQAS
ncbi:MAG: transcriptional regulator GcvA [Cyanobacteria bacterium P01_F01_bin.53]